jgi:predicted glycosyltransferase
MYNKPKILIHCQYVYGIGHFVRTIELCKVLLSDFQITLVSGGEQVPNFSIPENIDFKQLPSVYKEEGEDTLRVVEQGIDLPEVMRIRKALLKEYIDVLKPDIFLSEHFPFGLLFEEEVLTVIKAVKTANENCKIACSVRDIILTNHGATHDLRTCDILNSYFDLILAHGDPNIISLEATFPLIKNILPKIEYTGYVVEKLQFQKTEESKKIVLVSVAAGRIGSELITAVLESSQDIVDSLDCEIVLFSGAFQKEVCAVDFENCNVQILPFSRNEYLAKLQICDLLICLGGYNTIIEALSIQRSILVYRKEFSSGNREQYIRLKMFEELGLVESISSKEIRDGKLLPKVLNCFTNKQELMNEIDTNGAERSAESLLNLL